MGKGFIKKLNTLNITFLMMLSFALSSNIAVANIVESVINKENLKACYSKYGFGSKTGFTLKREDSGSINYKYQIKHEYSKFSSIIQIHFRPMNYL